jgi:hypothetical protein
MEYYPAIKRNKLGWRCSSQVKSLPSMCKALGSTSFPPKMGRALISTIVWVDLKKFKRRQTQNSTHYMIPSA